MDTSEQYIKQCEKGIQNPERLMEGGDVYAYTFCGGRTFLIYNSVMCLSDYMGDKDSYIWLPRQDQLQEIYLSLCVDKASYKLVFSLERWLAERGTPSPETSMEQLWLAFCQKELYNKVWDNEKEEWVNL